MLEQKKRRTLKRTRKKSSPATNAVVPTQGTKKITVNSKMMKEIHGMARGMVSNAYMTRTELLRNIIDGGGKDLNKDCGYPDIILPIDYALMYAREGIAARVVDVWPEECWSLPPLIFETEDAEQETEFEKMWKELEDKFHLLSLLSRADILSGIGRFGVVLIGIDDGAEKLIEPVEEGAGRQLLYVRTFQESVVQISTTEKTTSNSRFGQPTKYIITFNDGEHVFSETVDWTRIVHLADNREMSEIYGVPRMQKSYNRLLDTRKVLGGSGEMFWKGGFPGYSFEVGEGEPGVDLDTDSIREEMQAYMLGLQRYLAIEGVSAKSLAPQVANPKAHLESQLNAVAIAEGIPKRILFGSEQGELASSQDSKTWNRRLKKRQDNYITPMVIRPFIDRLIAVGVLPEAEYLVKWPDLATQTDKEKADVARSWAEAFSKYVAGDVDSVITFEDFLSTFGGLGPDEIKQITESLDQQIEDEEGLGAEEEEE